MLRAQDTNDVPFAVMKRTAHRVSSSFSGIVGGAILRRLW